MSDSPSTAPTVYLETFGCQMNELDSELVRGALVTLGYRFIEDWKTADVVLYNTCSVREQAEHKAYSRLGLIGQRKRDGESVVLGVIGCMAERDGKDIFRRYPQVDLLCGPGELDRLPNLIENMRRSMALGEDAPRLSKDARSALAGNKSRRSSTLAAADDNLELLDLSRAFEPVDATTERRSAYVRITRGCNKFCTYCVVPNTRGAEVHRPPDSIVEECRRLADSGVVEITLLGQTVNHYRYVHGSAVGSDGAELPQVGPGLNAFRNTAVLSAGVRTTTFAELLSRIHDEVPHLQRIRFLTSYPRDFGADVLEVMRDSPRICNYIHAPAQSGSDRILKLMNRGYTVGEYLEFVDRVFAYLPDATIAGDFIVGFPTETDEDFEATCALVRRVPFKNNYIFKYSARPGTVAIDRFTDDVPLETKKLRNNRLLDLQTEISREVHERWIGREVEVLLEKVRVHNTPRESSSPSEDDAPIHPGSKNVQLLWNRTKPRQGTQLLGRTQGDMIVVIDVPAGDWTASLGTIHRAKVVGASPLLLHANAVSAI
ncbi:MAG: MiaB/RimO family radical SAM methylthiotransferase [Phycisphaerales bacterium]|nr:MiaB/RimO family radical SAM methylthiotransferase [Phycisphaerales bacterium]